MLDAIAVFFALIFAPTPHAGGKTHSLTAMNKISRWVGWGISVCALMLAGCGGGGDDASASPDATSAAPSGNTAAGWSSSGAAPAAESESPQGSSTPSSPPVQDDGNPFNDPPATGTPIAKQDCGIANLASDIIDLLNTERARGASCGTRGAYQPAGLLTWNTLLEGAAIGHSQDMAANDIFSHVGSAGQTLAVRVDATGYTWMLLGENIAAGFDTPAETVRAWMESDGHCANVMNPQFRDIALACVPGTFATRYRNYWTLNFGNPR